MNEFMFQVGEKVKISLLELHGFVTAICIRSALNTTYEVSFFSNGEYHQKWFEDFELERMA